MREADAGVARLPFCSGLCRAGEPARKATAAALRTIADNSENPVFLMFAVFRFADSGPAGSGEICSLFSMFGDLRYHSPRWAS